MAIKKMQPLTHIPVINSREGLWIPQWVNELGLKGLGKELFAIILGFNTACKVFSGSLAYLEGKTGFGRRAIIKELKLLVDCGYLVKKEVVGIGCKYLVNPTILLKIARGSMLTKLSKGYNLYRLVSKVLSDKELECYNIFPKEEPPTVIDYIAYTEGGIQEDTDIRLLADSGGNIASELADSGCEEADYE